jgi:hypothetical protein
MKHLLLWFYYYEHKWIDMENNNTCKKICFNYQWNVNANRLINELSLSKSSREMKKITGL